MYVGTKKAFTVTNTPVMSALDRAQSITSRIQAILADPKSDPEHLVIRQSIDGAPVIMLDKIALCGVTHEDSTAFGKSATSLASDWMQSLKTEMLEAKKT